MTAAENKQNDSYWKSNFSLDDPIRMQIWLSRYPDANMVIYIYIYIYIGATSRISRNKQKSRYR